MKLLRLTLRNFRQFRGEQNLYFADLDERNVTIIHAENGFGKTALLNALLWGFYGHDGLTADFAGKDSILNKSVAASSIPEPEKVAEVEISFEHEGHKYGSIRAYGIGELTCYAAFTQIHYGSGTFAFDGDTLSTGIDNGSAHLLGINPHSPDRSRLPKPQSKPSPQGPGRRSASKKSFRIRSRQRPH